jgi:ABC-type glycerol-3-phosphate transport system permease component
LTDTTASSLRTAQPSTLHWRQRRSSQQLLKNLALYPLTLIGAAIMLTPLLWLLSSSLKSTNLIFIFPPQWIPNPVRFANYGDVFRAIPFAQFTLNTVIVTGLALLGQLLTASLVAFGFARLRFPGRDLLFLVLLGTIMIPYHITLIPTFVLFRLLGWLDTWLPLIVPYWFGGGAFFIFLLRQFFMRLPLELDDAAYIDGATIFGVYWRIILPQAKPALGVVAVFSFLNHWNDFFGPLIYLNSVEKYTLAIGINLFRSFQTTEWNLLMAASVMITLPCILLYALAQRFFIQGVVFTGLKQ